jgi:hypothetical protein
VFIEDPLTNLMATFNFTNIVLEEGMMFNFGSWVCVADGAGDFHQHLVDDENPEASAPRSHQGRCENLLLRPPASWCR